MTDDEWATVSLLLSKAWKGDFGPGEDRAYRLLLDGYEGEQIVLALRKLTAKGHFTLPSVSEIVQAIERDHSEPTDTEAIDLIFGPRGVLRARPAPGGRYESEAQMLAARDQAQIDRAWEIHPLLGDFVRRYHPRKLAMLDIDGDHAALIRKELQAEWREHCERNAHRDAAALAEGRRRELARGPQRIDFAQALAAGQQAQPEEEQP